MDKIQNNAMLVTATITKFANKTRDAELSADVAARQQGNPKSFTVTRRLLEAAPIKALSRIVGQLRNTVLNPLSVPWEDGVRLMPVENIETFEAEWIKKVDYAEELKREVVREWPKILKDAAINSGLSFDINDYPSPEYIISKYQFSYELRAMPDSGDIRVNLPAEKIAKIKADTEARITQRVEAAAESVHERVVDTLQALIDGLERHGIKADGAKRASKFTDNTVEKIEELAAVLPSLNITGDPKLTQAGNALLTKLADLDPAKLRESKTERKAVADTAKSIVDNLTGLWD